MFKYAQQTVLKNQLTYEVPHRVSKLLDNVMQASVEPEVDSLQTAAGPIFLFTSLSRAADKLSVPCGPTGTVFVWLNTATRAVDVFCTPLKAL